MKRFSLLGLTLLAAIAFSAFTAVSASAALPELLTVVKGTKWTGSGAVATLETLKGETVVCKEATGDGEQLTDTLGDYHIHFKKCAAAGGSVPCNSAGDESGVILILGEYHFVSDEVAPNVAILFLVGELKFECSALTHFVVTGHVLCLILKPLELSATHEFHCKAVSAGMPEDKFWTNDAGTKETAVLLTSKNGATAEESVEIALGTVVFSEPVAFHEPF